jgi:glutamate transport system permease protein
VDVVLDNRDLFLSGMRTTVSLTVLSFGIALVIGTVVAGFRVSPVPPLRAVGAFYVATVRNTPLAVLMVLFFSGFPDAGIIVDSRYVSAIIVLSAYTGAFVGETVRAGITVVAPLGSIFIALIKNSSLAALISVAELAGNAEGLLTSLAEPIPIFLGAAVCYLALTIPSGFAVAWLERKVAIKR